MTGYTRQSSANMVTGNTMYASDFNNEFNAIQSAFDGNTGHAHDGTAGNGPKINLTTSVTGVLPIANGGSGGINNFSATSAPTTSSDTNAGYRVGSVWIDTTNDIPYVCLDATAYAAVWMRYQAYADALASIGGLTTSDNQMIYTTGSNLYATTALTAFGRSILDDANAAAARGTLGLGSMATQNSTAIAVTGGTLSGVTISTSTIDGTHTGTFDGTHTGTFSGNGASLTTLNGSNISSGTVADAHLPTSMAGKVFTSPSTFNNMVYVSTSTNGGIEIGRTDGTASTPLIDFHSTATVVDYNVRLIASGGTTVGDGTLNIITGSNQLKNNENVIWHAGNGGAGSGLDADLLDGQQGSYYLDIGNATGSLNTTRVPWITPYARTILDDTSGAAVFDTLGATRSLGQSGQFRLPDGIIVKWGQATATGGNQTILFPSAFPNVAYACVLSCINEPGSNAVAYLAWQDSLNPSGFNARTRYMTNGGLVDATNLVFQYIAIGR